MVIQIEKMMMKKILAGVLFLVSVNAVAQDASQLKEMAIQACAAQVAQLPADQQAAASATCNCTAENTDYEKMMSANQAGDIETIKADALAVAEKCIGAAQAE